MKRVWCSLRNQTRTMANIPPRKISPSSKPSKQDASPLQILLQMGFPRHRALKALAATGNRSVQLASDWLLTHVNDGYIDADEPREYILYASPTGALLTQLHDFWAKSKKLGGWNGAHNFPPHITLVSFFKAPDDTSLQLAKAAKSVIETVGDPPACPLKLDPYISQNFMGLFVSEEHAEYLKKIAVQYVKEVSTLSINLKAHVKSLHITLAYHFEVAAFDGLKALVDELQPLETSSWELRLYSRDPKFANHQVHKVTQGYSPLASDELELVLGDYIYIEEKAFDSSPDGWVPGTSWLTGVSGYLPAVFTRRTAESDAWTLHRAISLGTNNSSDCKSESDSNTEGDMAGYPHEDATNLGHEKSEETYKEWGKYWDRVMADNKHDSIINVTQGTSIDWKANSQGDGEAKAEPDRRWFFAMRHGERVDLTYGSWVPFCFDESGNYVRKDLNMPLTLGNRVGGSDSYSKDTPLTRVGRLQAWLVGEGLRLAQQPLTHVYASSALRCVETAHCMLEGYQNPSIKVKVEPGLFEFKNWHLPNGMVPFMTPQELHTAGLNVDLKYKPYLDLDITTTETLEEFYKRNELVIQSAVKDTEAEGGNIMFIGHAATLDMVVLALKRLATPDAPHAPYSITPHLLRVPYCALAALRAPATLVSPPCPPSINSSSGRFDWKSKSEKDGEINATANENTAKVTETEIRQKEVTPVTKPNLLVKDFQKDKQDLPKADEIKEIQEKIKSTILASSTDNSLKTRRQKNVAVATLLKLGTIPLESVKLMKPVYFEKPPTNEEKLIEKVEKQTSTLSSVTNGNYIQAHDSIWVDSWFSSMECPKPKPQLQEKLVLKDTITFKKKTASSIRLSNG